MSDFDVFGDFYGEYTAPDSSNAAEDAKFARQNDNLNNGAVPLVTDVGVSTGAADPSTVAKLGAVVTNLPAIARDAGTVVGTLKRNLSQAGANFSSAQNAAASGNALSQWWLYSSTTDKLIVGLSAFTIIYLLVEKS